MTNLERALNILCKWRNILASWQLGTRLREDPEFQAVCNHRELALLMRAEVSALIAILIEKKVFTLDEYEAALENEAIALNKSYEFKFPGATASETGMHIDIKKAQPWLSKFPP